MSEEEWRLIPSSQNYEASSLGKIRRRAGGQGATPGLVIKTSVVTGGYLGLHLYHNDLRTSHSVHALVCEAFNGPKPTPLHEAAHLNGIKTDNRSVNLAWKTRAENHADKIAHGTACLGERNHASKLTASDVIDIRMRASSGESKRRIASIYSINSTYIFAIISRKVWKHV